MGIVTVLDTIQTHLRALTIEGSPLFHTDSVIISLGGTMQALVGRISPMCMVAATAWRCDEQAPDYITADIAIHIYQIIPGEEVGQFPYRGIPDADIAYNAGILTIGEIIHQDLSVLLRDDGIIFQFVDAKAQTPIIEDDKYFAHIIYNYQAKCSLEATP